MAELPRLNGIIKALEEGSVAFVGAAPTDGAVDRRWLQDATRAPQSAPIRHRNYE